MPLRLTLLESVLARLNLLPAPLFDTPLAPGLAKVLVTACELDLFNTLARSTMSRDDLAARLDCDAEGLQLLLQLLASAGYVRLRKGKYENTALARRWLTRGSPFDIAPYVMHSPDIVAIWDHLPTVVREHRQAMRMPYDEDVSNPETRVLLARHYAGLASLATALGREVVYRVRLPRGAAQVLDVGGSHAAYSAMFCQRYPRLRSTILDIPAGIEAGERTAKLMHLEHRMDFVVTDILRDDFAQDIPSTFDAALYFHIAHLLPPETNQALLAKVVKTLKPGGILAFVDQVTDQTHGSRLASLMVQFMALTMTTVGGTCYPFTTVKTWLEQCGMERVRKHRLITPGATLITARKPY